MYIRRITMQNVKSFKGEQVFELGKGVNFFIGNNNSGKSTILEAILFAFDGISQSETENFYCLTTDEPTAVTVDIAGDLEEYLQQKKFEKLRNHVFNDKGQQIIRMQRSSEERVIHQNGKDRSVSVKNICFWNPESEQFENITGIDALVKKLFDFEPVWADLLPSEHVNFASTKTLGRILDKAFDRFKKTDHWENLSQVYKEIFDSTAEDSFSSETDKIARDLAELVSEQYGDTRFKFSFDLPDSNSFMKQGKLLVNDGREETPVEGKGTGTQRAVTLGLIQLYAQYSATNEENESKPPLILMLDEPETWLHPTAQLKLGEALSNIGKQEQVFIVTHSPYLLRKFSPSEHRLTILVRKGDDREILTSTTLGLLRREPTWGEINYRAFDICSLEFHDELYGYISQSLGAETSIKQVDNFLVSKGLPRNKSWFNNRNGQTQSLTLSSYIRNLIHHPENNNNAPATEEELHNSTAILLKIVEEDLPPTVAREEPSLMFDSK